MFADSLASGFAGRRPLTPLDTIVPEETWWKSLCSSFCVDFDNIRWHGRPWCAFRDGKLAAILSCLCLPFRVLSRATGMQLNPTSFQQLGIIYFYVLLCFTVVFNLVEFKMTDDKSANNETPAHEARQYFVIVCMFLAIVAMLCLRLFTHRGVQYEQNDDAPLRIFLQGGLHLFGVVSMGHAVCEAINDFHCKHIIAAIVQCTKALYIVSQVLFLNRFYRARFPRDSSVLVRIALPHLLVTNLALWFWILCTEANGKSHECIDDKPIKLDDSQKYLYPFFVEYLILAASLIYEPWKDLLLTPEMPQQQCPLCVNRANLNDQRTEESIELEIRNRNLSRRQRYIPSCGYGIVFGACSSAIFLVLVLASVNNAKAKNRDYFKAYSWCTLALYILEIVTCYVVQVSLESQRRKREHLSLDRDDFLLYVSLGGILLWEGFHLFSLLLKEKADDISYVVDVFACVQHFSQAVTLVNVRRHRSARNKNSAWIRECVLFLLITNVGWWIQDSFFLDAIIDSPGENHADFATIDLEGFGYILKPMSIFFRFHSATCFYHAWSVFAARGTETAQQ